MKYSLPKEDEGFKITEVSFCGLDCLLINPAINPKWNKDNHFNRSIVVDKNTLQVYSCGWPKFFNYGESSELYPNIIDYTDINVFNKMDGSLVICDYVNDVFSMRTRGTADYRSQENYKDFEALRIIYPRLLDVVREYNHISFLFEIETPNNVIVIRSNDIKFTFLGAINKKELTCLSENEIDYLAVRMGVNRPKKHKFSGLSELNADVKNWIGEEGVVVSYNKNQNRIKIKSDWYTKLHRLATGIKNVNHLIDLWIDYGYQSRENFEHLLATSYDWEIVVSLKKLMDEMFEKWENIQNKLQDIRFFINENKTLSRKEIAISIINNYKEWSGVAFEILDGKKHKIEKLFALIS